VYDEVRKSKHKVMGSAMFELGEVLGARGNVKAKKLRPGGTLFLRVTAAPTSSSAGTAPAGTLHLALKGHKLKNVDGLFSKSDPFFEISARIDQASGGLTWQPVYRSKHIDNNLNPEWPPFEVDVYRLCGGDLNKPVLIKVFDWEKNGKHVSIGSCETTVNQILGTALSGPGGFRPADASKGFALKKRARQLTGNLIVLSARIVGSPSTGAPSPSSYSSMPTMPSPPGGAVVTAMSPPPVQSSSSSSSHGTPPFSQALDRPSPSFSTGYNSNAYASSAPPSLQSYDSGSLLPPPIAPPTVPGMPSAAARAVAPPARPVSIPPAVSSSSASGSRPLPTFVDYLSGGLELELSIAIDFTGSNGGTLISYCCRR